MGKIETLRRVPDASASRFAMEGDGWEALSPELLELLADGEPPAFATDSRERIVFWNRGAARVFGRRSEEALGRRCFEVVCGRDVFGNRLCYANCPISAMARANETICGFEARVPGAAGDADPTLVHVTILRIPGPRADLFTLVHVVQPIDPAAREARLPLAVERMALPEASAPDGEPPLTPREVEVLHLVAAGLQNKEIAQTLGLSLATVRNHVHNALEKLGVHSKLEMISMAFRKGWVKNPAALGVPS
jgi:DNA-binding CsgD family transcriptional regulator